MKIIGWNKVNAAKKTENLARLGRVAGLTAGGGGVVMVFTGPDGLLSVDMSPEEAERLLCDVAKALTGHKGDTVVIASEVSTDWTENVFLNVDLLMRQYCGHWMESVDYSSSLGRLVREGDEADRSEDVEQAAILAWRAHAPLPNGYHRLDRGTSAKAWAEGVKKWGEDWYENGDGDAYDYVAQKALFGKVKYKNDTKKRLIEALTKANGDREWSKNMADRIESGALNLPPIHSKEAHKLASKLRQEALGPKG